MSSGGGAGATGALRYAAFTDAGHGGNPAGIVLDAGHLGDAARLRTAAEIGYSETAFVEPDEPPGSYRVRYFSPLAEVSFCGHATIATAVAIAERDGAGLLRFSTLAGLIEVRTTVGADGVTATLTSVPTHTHPADPAAMAAALAPCAGPPTTSTRATPRTSPSPARTTSCSRSAVGTRWPGWTTTSTDCRR